MLNTSDVTLLYNEVTNYTAYSSTTEYMPLLMECDLQKEIEKVLDLAYIPVSMA